MDSQPIQDEGSQVQTELEDSEHLFTQLQQEKVEIANKLSEVEQLLVEKENLNRERHFKLLEANKQISELETTVTSLRDEIEIFVKMMSSVAMAESKKQENPPSPARPTKLLRIKDAKIESLKQQIAKLGRDNTQLQKSLLNEKQLRLSVEKSVMRSSEIYQKQIEELTAKIHDIEVRIKEDKTYREGKEAEDNEKLLNLTTECNRLGENFLKFKNTQNENMLSINESHNSSQRESDTPISEEVEKDPIFIESLRSKSRNIIKNLKDKLRSESSERPQTEEMRLKEEENEEDEFL